MIPALWLTLALPAQAQDCPAALQSAATELELAAASLERFGRQVADLEDEVDELDAELADALDLLEELRQAALDTPGQPIGAYLVALDCALDEAACPPEGEPIPVPEAPPQAGQTPVQTPPPKKKGLFGKLKP